ncbi:alpha-tocopherol transfer protein-like [Musca vetustissima]|uniref:alpha-tocopherol transfer protein-like n=1 Tax=Musca vetustissima TaxID=27455 RepID=UPI002AB7631C|nr:alpha-tocopherol transfer protein-like [Musca vetustissima]
MYKIPNNGPQFQYDGFLFKLDYNEPSEQAKKVAKEELNETPENVEKGIKGLRTLLKAETNLRCPLDNDLWLMSFLRLARFEPEAALEKIKKYYNYRRKFPDMCKDLKLSTIRESLCGNNGSMYPKRDQFGRRLYIILQGKYWLQEKFNKENLVQAFILQMEYFRCEQETQINGIVILLDVEGLTLSQVLLFTPAIAIRIIQYLQDGMGVRLRGYHIINNPKIFDIVYAITKPFINPNMYDIVHFHGTDIPALHRYISTECLPECYGGTLKSSQRSFGEQWIQIFEKYENDYEQYQEYGYK